MSAAFNRSTKSRAFWLRRYKPDAEACRLAIIDEWHTLCSRQARGDMVGAGISTTMLHDQGVMYFRARQREVVAA